jgi:predicted nucleotidyltransferase
MDRNKVLNQLKQIIDDTLMDCEINVYLFGSWARKEEKQTSDIDIALWAKEEIPIEKWVALNERIEESTVPYKVDLVNLSKAAPVFREKVESEGIVWTDCWKD